MRNSMTPAQYIREHVFGVSSQKDFGALISYSQAQISRFENGERQLSREAQNRIRSVAKKRKIKWDDRWFFEVPDTCKVA